MASDFGFDRPFSVGGGSQTTTRAYIGLSLSFGGGEVRPSFVTGVQSVRVRSSNRLQGIDLNARFNFTDGFERVAVAGLIGNRTAYANIGAGYNMRSAEPFGTVALQGAFLRAGADFGLSGSVTPYVEVNTLDRPRRVGGGALGCNPGYELLPASIFDDGFLNRDFVVDGQICVDEFFD